jgi:ATP-dependent Clp protease ATP-binding subunit ClpB
MQAEEEAKKLRDEYISVEHLLLGLVDDTGFSGRLLREYGIQRDNLLQALQQIRGHQRVTSPTPETTYQALERYGRDLTKLAAQGSSIRSSAAMTKFAASSRCFAAEPKTTRC